MYDDSQLVCHVVTAKRHTYGNHGDKKTQMSVRSDYRGGPMEHRILYMELGPVIVDIVRQRIGREILFIFIYDLRV